jgi:hypothetical protein
MDRLRHFRQMPLGGKESAPHESHRSTTSRPSAAADQNSSVSSETAGGMPIDASIATSPGAVLRLKSVRSLMYSVTHYIGNQLNTANEIGAAAT